MGFDNECIVNIQTLAGEYFCPVCRLLVYPNEALQSQCTHLYCKPCLTYIVGTTRACPYDGYLVTELDSKPLVESNKALAETIGKIDVRCLYYRSGCQWQGHLSDCSSHCSGCTFGNSPVVCNRCAIQIVHRQVQEHAQTCQGVQPQENLSGGIQNLVPTVAAAPANGEQPQTATQSVATNRATKTQTGAPSATVQDPNSQTAVNPQLPGVAPSAIPTAEQLYQQQYYQQYPGYDPYQQAYQNYYPYPLQPQVYAQPPQQMQAYSQTPTQQQPPIQSQTQVHAQAPPHTQGQAPPQSLQNVNSQYQIHNAAQPPAQVMPQALTSSQGYPHPQSYAGGQPHQPPRPTHPQSQPMQMPQFPQPQAQMQQHHPQMWPPLPPQAHSQHLTQQIQPHPHHQPMNQTLNPNVQPQTQQLLAHAVSGNHSYPQPQAQQQMQMGAQQYPNLHPQSGPIPQLPPNPHGQYPPQLSQMGVPQSHSSMPNQQLPPQGQVPGIIPAQQPPVNSYGPQPGHPAMQQVVPQQHMPQQHVFSGQASGPVHNQLHSRGQQIQLPPPPPLHPQSHFQVPSGLQPQQNQNYSARPVMPNHEIQPQPFEQSPAGYPGQAQARPPHLGGNQHLPNQNHLLRTNNPLQKNESPSQRIGEKELNGLASSAGMGTQSVEVKNLQAERDVKLGGNEDANRRFDILDKNTGAEFHKEKNASIQPTSNGGKSHETVGADPKDIADGSEQREKLTLGGNSKEGGTDMGAHVVPMASAYSSGGSLKPEEKNFGQSHGQVIGKGSAQPSRPFPPADQGQGPDFPMQYPAAHHQGLAGTMLRPVLPPGVPNHTHVPGQLPNMFRPQGPGQLPQSGQPFNLPSDHFQHPPFGKPPSQFSQHDSNFELQHSGGPRMPSGETAGFNSLGGFVGRTPLYGTEGNIGQQRPIGSSGNEIFPDPRSHYLDGQSPGSKSQVRNLREAVGTDSSTVGMHDERFNPLTGRVSRIPDKEPFGLNSDSGLKLEPSSMGAPGYGGHRMDRFASRSPGRENAGFPPRDFGGLPGFPRNQPDPGNIEGHESRLFDGGPRPFKFPLDPAGNPFHESGFPPLRGLSRWGELEGSGFMRGSEFQGHLPFSDPAGLGDFPGPARRGDLRAPENFPRYRPFGEEFGGNISGHPNLGDHGFRSSFPSTLQGGLDSFDNSRKRMLSNSGWCRICKVDCEGVEGLELHSQTREHQDMAMNMVRNIKMQNAKKQKVSNDGSSLEEPNKRRGFGQEVRGNRR